MIQLNSVIYMYVNDNDKSLLIQGIYSNKRVHNNNIYKASQPPKEFIDYSKQLSCNGPPGSDDDHTNHQLRGKSTPTI